MLEVCVHFHPQSEYKQHCWKSQPIVTFLEFWVMFGSLLAFQMTHQLLFAELIGSCLKTNEIG